MKIEKINDNQIRCTLNKSDLAARHIKLSELAYGTEKTRELFREMMKQASHEYGFEVDNQPIMIEAIPVSADCIILNISKVTNPDELDTRFSRFAPMFGDRDDFDDDEDSYGGELGASINEALEYFDSIEHDDEIDDEDSFTTLGELISNKIAKAKKQQRSDKSSEAERILIYKFDELSLVERVANVLKADYVGRNTLYKDIKNKSYYLVVNRTDCEQEKFFKITGVLSEYGTRDICSNAREAFLREHFALMIKDNALQMLSTI